MSHFSRIKTKTVEREFLIKALTDLGHKVQQGSTHIRGYAGGRASVEISIPTASQGYDIGFQKNGDTYELVADWWGIRDIQQDQFMQALHQRYAYHATKLKLEEQGFSITTEEKDNDGRIHLMLRRMV
jgi:hypothetical protein